MWRRKVFPTSTLENDPTQIANEVIDFASMTVKEGNTKPFVEIFREFSLTRNQVKQEADQKTCRTLARMAAKELALGEDAYFLQLSDRAVAKRDKAGGTCQVPVLKAPTFSVENWRTDVDFGLLAEANDPGAYHPSCLKFSVATPVVAHSYARRNALSGPCWRRN